MPTLVLQPDASAGLDSMIIASGPTLNFGLRADMRIGVSAGQRRGLLKFDLSSLPNGAVVTSATVTLVVTSETTSTNANLSLYRALVQWFEGNSNGVTPGAGVDASTYNLRNHNGSVAWGAAGGLAGTDYASSASASTLITNTGSFTWTVTTDVAGFANGSLTNHGWFIISDGSDEKIVASSDDSTAALRPTLTIVYTAPAGLMMLLGLDEGGMTGGFLG